MAADKALSSPDRMPRKRTFAFSLAAIALSSIVALVVAEGVLRLAFPQETMSPRWDFSAEYCTLPFPSVRMVHERPGRWRYVYTTNPRRGRGPALSVSNRYLIPNVVILGDSYSFGAGVNDGEEYASILARSLSGSAFVINLGVGGWGLTQQIRRYYEYGRLYDPAVVILQFSANDPEDNLTCPVTAVQNGRFEFHDTGEGIFRIKRYLSQSIIQKSQLYNSVRDTVYRAFAARTIARTRRSAGTGADPPGIPLEQRVHIELLSAFADDLHRGGVRLILLTVNRQLAEFPAIDQAAQQLARDQKLEIIDAADWLEGMTSYASPEGHLWGAPAHRVIGENLSKLIRPVISNSEPDRP